MKQIDPSGGVVGKSRIILQGLLLAVGVVLCLLFAYRSWTPFFIMLALLFSVPFILVAVKAPDFIIFLSLLLNFSPLEMNVGFYFILVLALILFIKNLFLNRPIVTFDGIIVLWAALVCIGFVTLPKWASIHRGIRGSLSLVIIPMLLYIIFNKGYLTLKAAERFFRVYFPMLYTYFIAQLVLITVKGTAVTGFSWQEFHSGFDLGWGKSVFVAALLLFFGVLMVRTRAYWQENAALKIAVYFDFFISIVFLVLIMARAPVVALLTSILIYLIYQRRIIQNDIKFKLSYIIYALLILIPLYLFFSTFLGVLVERFVHMKTDNSFLVRLFMYYDGWITFINNPLVGVGPDQHLFRDFLTNTTDPNNIFISYAVSFGAIGLLAIAAIFIMPYFVMGRLYKTKPPAAAHYFGTMLLPVLTLAVVNSCFEVIITAFSYGSLFWTTYALFFRLHDSMIATKSP